MRTSLIELQQIEEQLTGTASTPERLVFEARLLTSPNLREKTDAQQEAYRLIGQHGRERLKNRLEAVHQELFNAPKYAWWRRLFK